MVSNKQFLPDSYTSFKNKIGLIDDNDHLYLKRRCRVSLALQSCVLEGGQSKMNSKEMRYSE